MFEFIRSIRIDGDRADGTAHVPEADPLFADHFPGRLVLPGTWLVELAAQIAGPLAETVEPGRWAVLAMIRQAKLLAPVDLPASINIEATIVRRARDIVTTRGTIWNDDVTVLRTELVFALIEAPAGTEAAIRARHDRIEKWSR